MVELSEYRHRIRKLGVRLLRIDNTSDKYVVDFSLGSPRGFWTAGGLRELALYLDEQNARRDSKERS